MYRNVSKPPNLLTLTICLCLFGVIHVSGRRIPSYAGPYRILIDSITNRSNEYNSTGDFWINLRTSQVRGKQLQYGWGYSHTKLHLTDDMTVEVMMAVRNNNQWKKNAFIFKFDSACSSAKLHASTLMSLIWGGDSSCPLPAVGLKKIQNHSFELIFPKFPIMPYGRYLFMLSVFQSKTRLGLGLADMLFMPKL